MSRMNPAMQVALLKQEIRRLEGVMAQMRFDTDYLKGFTVQQCLDMAQIALGDEFGFGEDREKRFEDAFKSTFMTYAKLCIDDADGDEEIVYTKEALDRRLRACCGKVKPFDKRYAMENLYLRDKL